MVVLILLISSLSGFAAKQDSLPTQPKNVIYVHGGFMGLWFTASSSYERQLFARHKRFSSYYYLRASGGAYATWGQDGPYGSLSLQAMYGKKKSHLELGLGFGGLYDKPGYKYSDKTSSKIDYIDWIPAATIGYRYQKPGGGFVFRTGMAFPESAYLSFGYAF